MTMTVVPSDAVTDLLRQGKRNQAMKQYRREGATDEDINYLNTADSIATDRSISLEDAVPKGPPAPIEKTAAGFGWGTVILYGTCWILGIGVLWLDIAAWIIVNAVNSPCSGEPISFCGGHWTVGEELFVIAVALLGIGLLALPFLVRLRHMSRKRTGRR